MNSKQFKALEALKNMNTDSKFAYIEIANYVYATRKQANVDTFLYEISDKGVVEEVNIPDDCVETMRLSDCKKILPFTLLAISRNIAKRNTLFVPGEAFKSSDGYDTWIVKIVATHGHGYRKRYDVDCKRAFEDEFERSENLTIGQVVDCVLRGYCYEEL